MRRRRHPYRALVGFLILSLVAGCAAGYVTVPQIAGWYGLLEKPSFTPPDGVFAPVWTTLFIFMALAAWRVWRLKGLFSGPLGLYGLQLALNFAWSFIFFGAHSLALALIDMLALFIVVVLTGLRFWQIDRLAGLLFVPYIVWVGFLVWLNEAFWALNRG